MNRPVAFFPGALIALFLGAILTVGCSGSSGGNFSYSYSIPTDLTLTGMIDLSDVAIHQSLGGFSPSIRTNILTSLLDHSTFVVTIEDDSSVTAQVSTDGKFTMAPISIRDQVVLKFSNKAHPGFILEWMAADSNGISGVREVKATIRSTARSFIARALRNRYGRRISPELITDAQIKPVVDLIAKVLEQKPDLISASVPLDHVDEIVQAVSTAAVALNAAGSGVYPREWTILVYQGGDNSLDAAIRDDLEEMKKAGPPSGVTLLSYIDTPADGIRLLKIEKGKEIEIAKFGQGNSADVQKVAYFVMWANRVFPAKKFALILSSHGMGWRNAAATRGVITDDSENTAMDFLSLKSALTTAVTQEGDFIRPLDLIGFDACLMGLFEVAYQLRDSAKYMVFSQANEPAPGWPYDNILFSIATAGASIDAGKLGNLICTAYKNYYEITGLSERYSGTLSLVDLAKLPALLQTFDAWVKILYTDKTTLLPALRGIRDALALDTSGLVGAERYLVQAFEFVDYRDLMDLVTSLKTTAPQANLAADDLINCYSLTVPVSVRFGNKYTRSHGLSISYPDPGNFADYYNNSDVVKYAYLDLSQNTLWDELITEINLATSVPKFDGRNLYVSASWNTTADIDLYIGEPDPSAPNDISKIVWYSPAGGSATPNGKFSLESNETGFREESWTVEKTILEGKYWVLASYFRGSSFQAKTAVKISISWLFGNESFSKSDMIPGDLFEAATIQVASSSIQVKEIPSAEIPEEIIINLKQNIIGKNLRSLSNK